MPSRAASRLNAAVDLRRVGIAAAERRPCGPAPVPSRPAPASWHPRAAQLGRRDVPRPRAMKRARRSSRSSFGQHARDVVRRCAVHRLNRRSSRRGRCWASRTNSSRCSNSASVSPGKPAMKVLRITSSGQVSRQRCDALEVLLAAGRPLHALEHVGMRMLKRHVEVRQDAGRWPSAACTVSTLRVRIDVVQPHPGAVRARDLGELLAQFQHAESSPAGRSRSRCGT